MAGRVVAATLLAGLAGASAVVSVRAGDRPGGWEGPGRGMPEGMHERGHGPRWGGPHHGRWSALSPEDRAAFADARIAALHAGLKLNPDQEKLWPPVETALRDLNKQREARRERGTAEVDPPTALRTMADAATARGEALRKLADATGPLYATLDEGQKRRAMILGHGMGPGFGHAGWHHRMRNEDAPEPR